MIEPMHAFDSGVFVATAARAMCFSIDAAAITEADVVVRMRDTHDTVIATISIHEDGSGSVEAAGTTRSWPAGPKALDRALDVVKDALSAWSPF